MNNAQLIDATKAGDVNLVQVLIEGGAGLEQKDEYAWTALNWAAGRGDLTIVRALLDAGANAISSGRACRSCHVAATGREKYWYCLREACASVLQGLFG